MFVETSIHHVPNDMLINENTQFKTVSLKDV